MINVAVDDRAILAALRQLQNHAANLRPALREIGETLKESTQKRFVNTTGPDGATWAANSEVTSERKASRSGITLTDGGTLGGTINSKVVGNDTVMIYSPMPYAAMMQNGGTQAEFPHLWGDIPARPFLGISPNDESEILSMLRSYLESAL